MLCRSRSRASPKAVSMSRRLPRLPPSPNATTDARGDAALADGSVFVVEVLYLFDLGGPELRSLDLVVRRHLDRFLFLFDLDRLDDLGLPPAPRCLGGGRR